MKTNLSKVMKRAWEIKKQDKRNLFAICLKMAWEEERMATVEEYLKANGFKVWEKGSNKRIYVNAGDSKKLGSDSISTVKGMFCNFYYDCNDDSFFYSTTSSRKESQLALFALIRESAKTM